MLSILVLVLGLLGGAYLSNDRQTQQRETAAGIQNRNLVQLEQQQAALYAAAAPERAAIAAAQSAAQQKAAQDAAAAAAKARKAEDAVRRKRAATATTSRSTTRTPVYGPIPKSCGDYTGNRAIGCSLLLSAGFGLSEMPCLDKMWTKESNWRTTADNPSSHSYGIPQALPGSKMATVGSDYRTNPVTQIKWGLDYIAKRYKSPCGAWSFWQGHSFY